jgi:hypothetical protein
MHQRNIIKIWFLLAGIIALPITAAVGSIIVSVIIMAIVSIPVVFVIKKIFPAPDWYANEGEKTGMTSMNLSTRD